MKVVVTGFVNTMSKPQRIAGTVYLPFHLIVFPLFIRMMAVFLPSGLTNIAQNTIYYGLGLAFCLICMWKYLRYAYDILLDNFILSIIAICFSLIIYFLLTYLTQGLMFIILEDQAQNPNNNAIMDVASKSPNALFALTVFIAPIVEEILFRGVIFGSLRAKHRILAYVFSIGLFALYHVWQYALGASDWKMLVYVIEYLPAGYVLAWLYEKTNCIWLPIFMHMAINLISMLVLV